MLGNILAVGLMSMGMGLSGVKDEPQMYAENAETYTITYNEEDWQNKASSIKQYLLDNSYTSYANSLTVTGYVKTTQENQIARIYYTNNSNKITIENEAGNELYQYSTVNEKWSDNSTEITVNEIKISNQNYYENLKEPPTPMGEQIIPTIASGLGIIGALATTFLTGFGNLFYSSGALTPFAIFALVMLGVAVSFSVVKLVLNLIRSNTGA